MTQEFERGCTVVGRAILTTADLSGGDGTGKGESEDYYGWRQSAQSISSLPLKALLHPPQAQNLEDMATCTQRSRERDPEGSVRNR